MPLILSIALPVPVYHPFDYIAPAGIEQSTLKKGLRVLVPFGKKEKIGFLVGVSNHSKLSIQSLKTAIAIIDKTPLLTDSLLTLIDWTSNYYHCPLGEVYINAIPSYLRQKEKINKLPTGPFLNVKANESTSNKINLNAHQQHAVETITKNLGKFTAFLLHGITGSGKTEVYLQVIEKVLARDEQALVLVPEIGLTPQLLQRFQNRFNVSLALFHSGLTDRQRLTHWLAAQTGEARIIIGTRSALFTPLQRPGLIVVDEEHDHSFKQQRGLRYHARDLALMRSKLENIPVVLGSATASLETLANTQRKRLHFLSLPQRTGAAKLPHIELIDIRQQQLEAGISPLLLQQIDSHLKNDAQVLLFLNRRGFSPLLICHDCGWTADCKHCDQKLVLHKHPLHLQCHFCGFRCPIPSICPNCNKTQLVNIGQGTQRIEAALKNLFPAVEIIRIDKDNIQKKGNLEKLLQQIQFGQKQILIGTQILAKGHHFPNVTLVGILEIDAGLFSADFRAMEHTGQLVMQVAGRAGRENKLGSVFIQTHHPEHPLLQLLLKQDYLSFSKKLLTERLHAQLPPFTHLALIHAEALKKSAPLEFLKLIRQQLNHFKLPNIALFGPIPALHSRRAGYYRAQMLIQSKNRKKLHEMLKQMLDLISKTNYRQRVRWSLDVDPLEIT